MSPPFVRRGLQFDPADLTWPASPVILWLYGAGDIGSPPCPGGCERKERTDRYGPILDPLDCPSCPPLSGHTTPVESWLGVRFTTTPPYGGPSRWRLRTRRLCAPTAVRSSCIRPPTRPATPSGASPTSRNAARPAATSARRRVPAAATAARPERGSPTRPFALRAAPRPPSPSNLARLRFPLTDVVPAGRGYSPDRISRADRMDLPTADQIAAARTWISVCGGPPSGRIEAGPYAGQARRRPAPPWGGRGARDYAGLTSTLLSMLLSSPRTSTDAKTL